MSFGIGELVIQGIIQDGLANLRRNPHHLEYILGKYCENEYVRKRVGDNFIHQAMELIQKHDLLVRPAFTLDKDIYPCLIIAAAYTEEQKYLGDYGSIETLSDDDYKGSFSTQPTVYLKFDANSVVGDEIRLSRAYDVDKKLFVGAWVVNGKEMAKIKGILPETDVNGESKLILSRKLPSGLPLKGWEVRSLPKKISSVINGSHNSVTVQMSLFTSGDPELHRVYAQIIRYCLKRGRKLMEEAGLQNASFSQQALSVAIEEGPVFRTTFSMECVEIDTWIESDVLPVERIDFDEQLVSDDPNKEPAC